MMSFLCISGEIQSLDILSSAVKMAENWGLHIGKLKINLKCTEKILLYYIKVLQL